jgi:SNF2 family DNA or RNA helicase
MMGRLFEAKDGVVRIIELDSIKKLEHLAKMLGQSEDGKKRKGKKNAPIPRLHLFDWISARAAGIECRLPPSEEKLLKSLLSFEGIPELPVPSGLNAKLRDYQRRGYEWMAFLYKHRFGACLADDMGLGKTVQTITLLGAVREKLVTQPGGSKPLPHLIVLPPTLLFNWRHEIETFYPGINVVDYLGGNRKAQFSPGDVVLTTYELARRDIDILKHITFDVMVFDEAQAIKNLAGARSQAMRHLQARFKLCLTGTPLENHAGEYYSILELALPGLFGSYEGFRASLRNGGTILQRAKPFVLRRTKEKILKELPPKVESDIYLDLTETQREFYTRAVGEVREEVLAAYGDRTAQQAGIVALAALTRLRQICISPAIIDPSHEERSPKLEQLLEQLEELVAEGHAGIVFSQYVRALDLLDKELKAAKMPFLRMDGSTPTLDRKGLVKQFQEGSGPSIFLISLKTGGAGLNLTRASHVFHLDPWWNPAVENQASDRAHRIGQKNTVFIHRLLMRHTVEEKMMELKRKKQDLFRQIVENSESPTGGAMITKEDFTFLLGQ